VPGAILSISDSSEKNGKREGNLKTFIAFAFQGERTRSSKANR
jgi:hypothetical protein